MTNEKITHNTKQIALLARIAHSLESIAKSQDVQAGVAYFEHKMFIGQMEQQKAANSGETPSEPVAEEVVETKENS